MSVSAEKSTLYALNHPVNVRSHKIHVTAAVLGKTVTSATDFDFGIDNESDTYFLNCHPIGRTPTLETAEGYVFESSTIMRHIARDTVLYGRNIFEASEVDQWLDYANSELDAPAVVFLSTIFGVQLPETILADSSCKATAGLSGLERVLETRTFLVGERMTIADIGVAFTCDWIFRFMPNGAGIDLMNRFPNVKRLYRTVMLNPLAHTYLAAAQVQDIGLLVATQETKKKDAPKKSTPAAAPVAKKAAKKQDEEDTDETTVVKTEKKPNPLDLLPPSEFVMDAWKREYSNTDTRSVAAPYFFKNYDAAGYSCYWCKYKYNEDNKMQFMTANLVRGWFQRMEHTRKYAFGIALIIGEDKCHDIVGFWMFRGKGIPEIVNDVCDTELFDWEEVKDVKAAEATITDYLCWEGTNIPKPVLEGRCFK